MLDDSVRNHNEAVKEILKAEETTKKRRLELSPLGVKVLVAVTVLLVGFAWWRLTQPLVYLEPPPDSVELVSVGEIPVEGFLHVQAQIKNNSTRPVAKVVYQVQYPGDQPEDTVYLVAEKLNPGQDVTITHQLVNRTAVPASRQVTPLYVEWGH